jgi:RNA polymerase sigma-70 factor (ECF subfamily)
MGADTDLLVDQAAAGDQHAADRLLLRHRARLRAMVRARLDRRLSRRLDPSDVVQEGLLEAHRRLPEYLAKRPIAFYPWIRQLVWEKLVRLHQQHLHTKQRSVRREVPFEPLLNDDSIAVLASQLFKGASGIHAEVIRAELQSRVKEALGRLKEVDQELLIQRYVEQLTVPEITAILKLKESAVKLRLLRALRRLRDLIDVSS